MKALKILGVIIVLLAVIGVIIFFTLRSSDDQNSWICVKGEWVKQGNPDSLPPLEPCLTEEKVEETTIANPASVNCENQGGKLETRENIMGGQYGVCMFENGKECEEWALLRGECSSSTEPIISERRGASTTLKNPLENDLVVSPLVIEGSMPGNWYFEANAVVELYDANGKRIAQGPLTAKGEWMTTSMVPFAGKLEFQAPETPTGTLVLKNDNPSDLRENDRQESYPIIFGTKVKVFFGNSEKDPGALDCTKVFEVVRIVPKTPDIARASLNELLKGVSETEKAGGYFTSINDDVIVQKLTIEDGVARVDFSPKLEEEVGGSCRVSAISSQIINTLKQFSSVKNVVISIDGRIEDILQP